MAEPVNDPHSASSLIDATGQGHKAHDVYELDGGVEVDLFTGDVIGFRDNPLGIRRGGNAIGSSMRRTEGASRPGRKTIRFPAPYEALDKDDQLRTHLRPVIDDHGRPLYRPHTNPFTGSLTHRKTSLIQTLSGKKMEIPNIPAVVPAGRLFRGHSRARSEPKLLTADDVIKAKIEHFCLRNPNFSLGWGDEFLDDDTIDFDNSYLHYAKGRVILPPGTAAGDQRRGLLQTNVINVATTPVAPRILIFTEDGAGDSMAVYLSFNGGTDWYPYSSRSSEIKNWILSRGGGLWWDNPNMPWDPGEYSSSVTTTGGKVDLKIRIFNETETDTQTAKKPIVVDSIYLLWPELAFFEEFPSVVDENEAVLPVVPTHQADQDPLDELVVFHSAATGTPGTLLTARLNTAIVNELNALGAEQSDPNSDYEDLIALEGGLDSFYPTSIGPAQ